MPRTTFLYDEHVRLGSRIVDFHGWELPVQYEGVLAEHHQCRRSVALFDTCHMGQFLVRGAQAADDLAGLLTRDAAALEVGHCGYALLLNEQGGIIDDTILIRLSETEFLLVVNAGTAESDFEWVSSHVSKNIELIDQARTWGKLDVQGPGSFQVLASRVDLDLSKLAYFTARRAKCCGSDCIISRTGYTGELGYEIFIPADALRKLFRDLLDEPSVKPAGLGARDLLRLEMCYPLYSQDISSTCNPLESDLDRFVSKDHEFIGSAALKQAAAKGIARKLIAFVCETRRRPAPDSSISHNDEVVGLVTSGAFSPSLDVSIGMGFVAVECAAAGTQLTIDTGRALIQATVQAKPLYKNGTCRKKLSDQHWSHTHDT